MRMRARAGCGVERQCACRATRRRRQSIVGPAPRCERAAAQKTSTRDRPWYLSPRAIEPEQVAWSRIRRAPNQGWDESSDDGCWAQRARAGEGGGVRRRSSVPRPLTGTVPGSRPRLAWTSRPARDTDRRQQQRSAGLLPVPRRGEVSDGAEGLATPRRLGENLGRVLAKLRAWPPRRRSPGGRSPGWSHA